MHDVSRYRRANDWSAIRSRKENIDGRGSSSSGPNHAMAA
jgi:hypothetical protein